MHCGVLKIRRPRLHSFTLIELLVVILIIGILAALTLTAGEGVMNQMARGRTRSEIAAIGSALENYKTDNGAYPTNSYAPQFSGTNSVLTYSSVDGSTLGGQYQVSSQNLYEALTGKTNFTDTPVAGVTSYMNFKAAQLGNTGTAPNSGYSATASTYIEDGFGYSYGYNVGTANEPPIAGAGFYDLWSTGGALTTTQGGTNNWIANWQQ